MTPEQIRQEAVLEAEKEMKADMASKFSPEEAKSILEEIASTNLQDVLKALEEKAKARGMSVKMDRKALKLPDIQTGISYEIYDEEGGEHGTFSSMSQAELAKATLDLEFEGTSCKFRIRKVAKGYTQRFTDEENAKKVKLEKAVEKKEEKVWNPNAPDKRKEAQRILTPAGFSYSAVKVLVCARWPKLAGKDLVASIQADFPGADEKKIKQYVQRVVWELKKTSTI